MEVDLLKEIKEYIEQRELSKAGEYGTEDSIAELLEENKMPSLYFKICKLIEEQEGV